ncbi:hypothetical protein B0H16DRAFT_105645 [Mycena metata]|uniref:Uncharacterized protein n=1 Tax=Mycena metata TaxID=1033252 RepID=A0AAD7MY46_9AGAR|nr:hypothetical protein B0H16DRAFT_105645 [Mycena metata]
MAAFLPPELERDIFELFVESSGTKSIPPLLCVARRVKLWVEPFLYRITFVGPTRFEPKNAEKTENALLQAEVLLVAIQDGRLPPSFFDAHVQHVFVDSRGYPIPSRDTILAALTGTTDLFLLNILAAPSLLAHVRHMPLRRLQANLGSLFGVPTDRANSVGTVDFSAPMFARLTHLAVFDDLRECPTAEWAAGLASLPALTHLSFEHNWEHPLFWEVLDGCAALRVFVVLVDPEFEQVALRTALERDERAVMMEDHKTYEGEKDWYRGARGSDDYWERAERLLRERRSGERR